MVGIISLVVGAGLIVFAIIKSQPGWFKKHSRQPEPKVSELMVERFLDAESWDQAYYLLRLGEEEWGQSPLLADATITWIRQAVANDLETKDSGDAEILGQLMHLLEDARTTSIDAAWARFKQKLGNEPTLGVVKEDLAEWFAAGTWEVAQQMLIRQQDILLSRMALSWMRHHVALTRHMHAESGAKELRYIVEIQLHWLEDAQANGVTVAWNNMTALIARHRAAKAALETLFVAQNWGEAQQVLLQHKSALLSEEARQMLDHNIFQMKAREQLKRAGQLELHLRLLERAHTRGIHEAVDSLKVTPWVQIGACVLSSYLADRAAWKPPL
jgi:hypothetical protein